MGYLLPSFRKASIQTKTNIVALSHLQTEVFLLFIKIILSDTNWKYLAKCGIIYCKKTHDLKKPVPNATKRGSRYRVDLAQNTINHFFAWWSHYLWNSLPFFPLVVVSTANDCRKSPTEQRIVIGQNALKCSSNIWKQYDINHFLFNVVSSWFLLQIIFNA